MRIGIAMLAVAAVKLRRSTAATLEFYQLFYYWSFKRTQKIYTLKF